MSDNLNHISEAVQVFELLNPNKKLETSTMFVEESAQGDREQVGEIEQARATGQCGVAGLEQDAGH